MMDYGNRINVVDKYFDKCNTDISCKMLTQSKKGMV